MISGTIRRARPLGIRIFSQEKALRSLLSRNTLFVLFLGGILAYGAGLAWFMLARFDLVDLIQVSTIGNADDAFYYFQIARNLAAGHFSTFDGGITQTNGYHPLWMLLITPFYWAFDSERALFGIKAFEIMLIAGGVALIALAARLARLAWILLFAVLPMLYSQFGMLLGMEAAVALFVLGSFFLALTLYAHDPDRWKWLLAAIAFVMPWARLEYIAISLAVTAMLCLVEWARKDQSPVAFWRGYKYPPPFALVPFIFSISGILVYFAYNWLVFDGIVPVSGATKQVWSQLRWEGEGGYSFFQNLRDILRVPVFRYELLVALEICAYVLLMCWFACRSGSRRDWLLLVFLIGVFGLAAGHLAKFTQTVLDIHPRFAKEAWYFVPAYLMMALIIPVRCYIAIHLIHRFIGSKSRYVARIASSIVIASGMIFLLTAIDFKYPYRHVENISENSFQRDVRDGVRAWVSSYLVARVMNRTLPQGSVIGTWDAGIIGYFSRFPVVNLDGLVNSYDYLRAPKISYRLIGTVAPEYVERFGITHYAAHYDSLEDENLLFQGAPFLVRGDTVLQQMFWQTDSTKGYEDASWLWGRMSPHFAYESDDLGVFVENNLAQVFVRKCEPERIRKSVFALSWSSEEYGTTDVAQYKWRNAERNRLGFCMQAFEMPEGSSLPIRIEIISEADYLSSLIHNLEPEIRSDFDVYMDVSGNRLIYVKEECEDSDKLPKFFLHIDPIDKSSLPNHRKQYAFDNLDFSFGEYVISSEEPCATMRGLPEYAIAEIRTGQHMPDEGRIWEGRIRVGE